MASSRESTQEIGFSREETVAAVQDFYAFVTAMFADETAFESAPNGGWPSITQDSMRLFGKTDEIVDLLRHLPYPADEDSDRRPQVMPALTFAAFQLDGSDFCESSESATNLRKITEGMISQHVPPHIVGLAERPPNDHGVLLDTKLGVVWWHEAAGEFKSMTPFPTIGLPDDDEDMTPGERFWRPGCDTVWTIPNFFATLKHNLKELHFVPMSRRRMVDGWYEDDAPDSRSQEAVDMVKGIYRAHGWPDLERYRKKDCLKAIQLALRENFPGEEDEDDDELDDDEQDESSEADE